MKSSGNLQITSSLSSQELEDYRNWLASIIVDYENKSSQWAQNYFEENGVFELQGLGEFVGRKDLKEYLDWTYQAMKSFEVDPKSAHFLKHQIVFVIEVKVDFKKGDPVDLSWVVVVDKEPESGRMAHCKIYGETSAFVSTAMKNSGPIRGLTRPFK
ncbi:hypothetical protein CC2G_002288 [Coprinopsis cinerea AmutBmut pab1-1]|nr:hypothetical protein CC2G_002288 [Coprinopsis cinerea AmutBmut pab1-1]